MRKIGLLIVLVVAGISFMLFAAEADKGQRSENKSEEVLQLRYAPLLDKKGMPSTILGMIVNTGDEPLVVKSSDMHKEGLSFYTSFSVEINREGDESGLDPIGTKVYRPGKPEPENRAYLLEPEAFVGVVIHINKELWRESLASLMKRGRKATINGSIAVLYGPANSEDHELTSVTLRGEHEFIINPYSKKKGK